MTFSRVTCLAAASASALIIEGCAGFASSSIPAPQTFGTSVRADARFKSFAYTGKPQRFTVPAGITQVTIVADGAAGGSTLGYYAPGGRGGRVHAVVPVTSGETLYVYVGGVTNDNTGGFNGGGRVEGWGYCGGGFGGGGASDVREGGRALSNRIVVAGGGGGGGGDLCGYDARFRRRRRIANRRRWCRTPPAAARLRAVPAARKPSGGLGGKAGSGSSGHGEHGRAGKLGVGGAGGEAVCGGRCPSGGAGGGGYYGGGGGGGGGYDSGSGGGGGGGGSSYVEPSAKGYRWYRGWKDDTGNGYVTIEW